MSDSGCDREKDVFEALRLRELEPELLNHMTTCVACADLALVSKFLQDQAGRAMEPALPDAGLIWRKALLHSRRKALARATWPIQFLRSVAALTSVVAALWLVFNATELPAWLSATGNSRLLSAQVWKGYWAEVVWLGGAGTLLCAFLGSFFMLWTDGARMRSGHQSLS